MDNLEYNRIREEALAQAILEAQKKMKPVHKDGKNTYYSSTYVTLHAVREATLPHFHAAGIAVVQEPRSKIQDGRTYFGCITHLIHTTGAKVSFGPVFSPISKEDPQGIGSAFTYLRRYCLLAVAGLAPEDDDGNQASQQTDRQDHGSGGQEQKPAPGGDPMEIIQSGKHAGKLWKAASEGYIRWVLENLSPDSTMYKGADNQERERRMYDDEDGDITLPDA